MTYNVEFKYGAIKELRDTVLARLEDFQFAKVAENMWFNGKYGGYQIKAVGFQTEEERVVFVLEFSEHCHATDKQFKWGFDSNDIDF